MTAPWPWQGLQPVTEPGHAVPNRVMVVWRRGSMNDTAKDTASDRALRDEALAELESASRGAPSGPAVRELVHMLTPVIQSRAARVLLAHGRGRGLANLREMVEENVQMVLGKLFENRAHVLRIWTEDGGLSLKNWVGRFATLRCRDGVRSAKRDPWRDQASPPDFFESLRTSTKADHGVETRELWGQVRAAVLEGQSERGREMFRWLFEEDASTAEIQDATGMTDAAIFQWRRRLRVAIRETWDALASEGGT